MVEFADSPSTGKELNMNGESGTTSSGQATPNGGVDGGVERSRKRKRRSRGLRTNGSISRRRLSVSKPARDPRDEASPARPETAAGGTRSPTPVIDFDGLSRPSKFILPPWDTHSDCSR